MAMTLENGRESQAARSMKVEALAKTAHAESEKAAYSKQDACKWLLR